MPGLTFATGSWTMAQATQTLTTPSDQAPTLRQLYGAMQRHGEHLNALLIDRQTMDGPADDTLHQYNEIMARKASLRWWHAVSRIGAIENVTDPASLRLVANVALELHRRPLYPVDDLRWSRAVEIRKLAVVMAHGVLGMPGMVP
jgi:hypothetical protein